jgi:hypothetical protein
VNLDQDVFLPQMRLRHVASPHVVGASEAIEDEWRESNDDSVVVATLRRRLWYIARVSGGIANRFVSDKSRSQFQDSLTARRRSRNWRLPFRVITCLIEWLAPPHAAFDYA